MASAKWRHDRERQAIVEDDGAYEVAPRSADLDHLLEHREGAEHSARLGEASLLCLVDVFDSGLGMTDDRVADIGLENRDAAGNDRSMHGATVGDGIEWISHGGVLSVLCPLRRSPDAL